MRYSEWDVNLKVRLYGEAFVDISFWMIFPFLTLYFSETLGRTTAGILLITSQLITAFTGLLGGFLADKFGRKRMLIVAISGEIMCFVLFAFARSSLINSPLLVLIAFTGVSIAGSFYQPAAQAMIADVVPEKHRAYVFSIFFTMLNIAVVVGPLLGAVLYINYPVQSVIVIIILESILLLALVKLTHETAPSVLGKEPAPKQTVGAVLKEQFASYKVVLRDKLFLMFIIAGILTMQTIMQIDMLFPIYIKEVIPTTVNFLTMTLNAEQVFAITLAINGFIVALTAIAVTKWMSRYKEGLVFVLSCIFYAVGLIIFGSSISVWQFIIAMIVFSIAEVMVVGFQQSFVARIAPIDNRAMYFSASGLRNTIGRVIAPLMVTISVGIGYFPTFVVMAILALISGVIYHFVFKMEQRKLTTE